MGYLRESASFTRPANTTAYAAGDLVANDATAGGGLVVVPTVSLLRLSQGLRVSGGWLEKSGATVTNAAFLVHLFSGAIPVPTKGDNEALAASQVYATSGGNAYRGSLSFAAADWKVFSDRSVCFGIPLVTSRTQILLGASPAELELAFLIEANAAYTPASAETFSFTPQYEPINLVDYKA